MSSYKNKCAYEKCETSGSATCKASGNKLLRCSKCKAVYYCNRKCQELSWFAGHNKVCGMISKSVKLDNGNFDEKLKSMEPDDVKKLLIAGGTLIILDLPSVSICLDNDEIFAFCYLMVVVFAF